MSTIKELERKLIRTEHLKNCPVYGESPKDDIPCNCPKITQKQYIKRLELKIRLMRYFVPIEKEIDITNKILKT